MLGPSVEVHEISQKAVFFPTRFPLAKAVVRPTQPAVPSHPQPPCENLASQGGLALASPWGIWHPGISKEASRAARQCRHDETNARRLSLLLSIPRNMHACRHIHYKYIRTRQRGAKHRFPASPRRWHRAEAHTPRPDQPQTATSSLRPRTRRNRAPSLVSTAVGRASKPATLCPHDQPTTHPGPHRRKRAPPEGKALDQKGKRANPKRRGAQPPPTPKAQIACTYCTQRTGPFAGLAKIVVGAKFVHESSSASLAPATTVGPTAWVGLLRIPALPSGLLPLPSVVRSAISAFSGSQDATAGEGWTKQGRRTRHLDTQTRGPVLGDKFVITKRAVVVGQKDM